MMRAAPASAAALAWDGRAASDAHAHSLRFALAQLWLEGITNVKEIAATLNARGGHSSRGGQWYPTSVQRLIVG
jgi:hypothetical protein